MAHPGLFLLPLFTALVLLINGILLCSVEVIRIGGSIDPPIIPKNCMYSAIIVKILGLSMFLKYVQRAYANALMYCKASAQSSEV